MPKLDLDAVPFEPPSRYPPPYNAPMAGRRVRRVAPAGGLADFGASHVTLEPGAMSSQRHWHEGEDELVVMLGGEAVLIENEGETILRAGDYAVFPKGVANGHCMINRSDRPCTFLAVAAPWASDCHYPDTDMHLSFATKSFLHKDGTPYG